MGRRLERVASLLKEEISRVILYELADPRMGFITITGVKPSADLQRAAVYVSILGNAGQIRTTLRGLQHARGHIQELVSQRAILRYTPRLTFIYDESVSGVERITRKLKEALGTISAEDPPEAREAPPAAPQKEEEE